MPRYLILQLDGPMQAWGTHTYEDFRPSNLFPTRSGLLGLLSACLGIDRKDHMGLESLAVSVEFSVRTDRTALRPDAEQPILKAAVKLPDFHTVLAARKVDGSPNKNPVVSRREYLFDAAFTIAIGEKPNAKIPLEDIASALRRPYYTPVLGRRSCPITRPLLEGDIIEASNAITVLARVLPAGGLIYTEDDLRSAQPIIMRDVPMHGFNRQFGTRQVCIHKGMPCS